MRDSSKPLRKDLRDRCFDLDIWVDSLRNGRDEGSFFCYMFPDAVGREFD